MKPSQFARAIADARALNTQRFFGTDNRMYSRVNEWIESAQRLYDAGGDHVHAIKHLSAAGGLLESGDGPRTYVWWLWANERPADLSDVHITRSLAC